jgi:hypothetical protein
VPIRVYIVEDHSVMRETPALRDNLDYEPGEMGA